MEKAAFDAAEPHIDQIEEALDELLESPALDKVREPLLALAKALGQAYGVELDLRLAITECDNERSLTLISMGMATFGEEEPYRTFNSGTFQKFIVDGEVCVVPNTQCPACWDDWIFKFEHSSCPSCGAKMAEDVKLLLDTDVCPSCEQGTISASNPRCSKCGFEVDPKAVVWG